MVGRHHHDRGPAHQDRVLELGRELVAAQQVDQAEVEGALEHAVDDAGVGQVDHLDGGGAAAVLEGQDRGRHHRRGAGVHGADAHGPGDAVLVARRRTEPVDGLQHLGHVGEQLAAGAVDPGPAAVPVEQGDPELALQLADALAEGRLRDVQVLARPS